MFRIFPIAILLMVSVLSSADDGGSCPAERGIYVLNKDGWTPMRGIYPNKIIQGHMKAMGGAGIIAIFKEGESASRAESDRPMFCAVGALSNAPITLIALQSRGTERRVIIAKASNWKGAYARRPRWFDPESVVPVTAAKVSDDAFTFSPELSLHNGEYAIFVDLPDVLPSGRRIDPHLVKAYDFGRFAAR